MSDPRLLSVGFAAVLILCQLGAIRAADNYDGQWTGSAVVTDNGHCQPASVTLTVTGHEATGQAKFFLGTPDIAGTISMSGNFIGTVGVQPLTGKFTADVFEAIFNSYFCAWKMTLKRNN